MSGHGHLTANACPLDRRRPLGRGLPTGDETRYIRDVLWLGRPPYLRWFAALSLVVAALVWDVSGRSTEPFPFAATDLARGEAITEANIEWRPVPVGELAMPDLQGVSASTEIRAGDPIVVSLVTAIPPLPPNWWTVGIPLPFGVPTGAEVRLVFFDGSATSGIVIQPATEDSLGLVSDGLVAVPGEVADSVALAAANGDLVVLIEP